MPKFSDEQLHTEIETARDQLPALSFYGKAELAKRKGQRLAGRPRLPADTEQRRKWRDAKAK